MEYNLGSKSGTLVGNWVESRTLEAVGQPARVPGWDARKIATGARVLPVSADASAAKWATAARSAMSDVLLGASEARMGPRERATAAKVAAVADEYARSKLAPVVENIPTGTTAAASYRPPTAADYGSKTGRSSAHVPPPAGAAAALGHTVRGRGGAGESKGSDDEEGAAPPGSLGATMSSRVPAPAAAAYGGDVPLTYYTARLAEGVFPKGPIKNAHNPFAKSTAFTNPIEEGHRVHAEANETGDAAATTTLGSSLALTAAAGGAGATLRAGRGSLAAGVAARAPGSEVALARLFARFAVRLAQAGDAREALAGCLVALRDTSSPPEHLGATLVSATAAGVPYDADHGSPDLFRRWVHTSGVLLHARDVECLLAALDDDATARVSLPLLCAHLAAALPPARAAVVAAILGGASAADASDVASQFVPPRDAPRALPGLLAALVEADVTGSGTVTEDTLAAYFTVAYALATDAQFAAAVRAEWPAAAAAAR